MSDERSVETHYGIGEIGVKILSVLSGMGKDVDRLTPADLALVDEFHIRGREATEELAALAGLGRNTTVLDVGSGLGGSVRYFASEHGCRATGIDLTEEYCTVAAMLSERTGLAGITEFHNASALDMPFEDESFDVVWTEHVQMNVSDKSRMYSEIARVLKPGGRLAFHDIFRGEGTPRFPVPWAPDPSISHLVFPHVLRDLLESLSFREVYWVDRSDDSRDWLKTTLERNKHQGPPPLGIHLLMGTEAPAKLDNVLLNLWDRRITVVQAVLEKNA